MPKKRSKSRSAPSSAEADGEGESLKVAVRVRPFNKRELDRKAKCCVKMSNNQTIMVHPSGKEKEKMFAFDHSYWSFDGGRERSDGYMEADPKHANKAKYCDQERVFNDLGKGILENAWSGYNSTVFAYGQTGSGKSYSVVGYGVNKGIVPIDDRRESDKNITFEVSVSMLEIYNEVVRDLLNPKCDKKRGLRVREHPKKGFWAENLTVVPVDSYEKISAKMDEGTTNRTIASTNMNATSSRAHTIVCVTFVQKSKNAAGDEMAKSSSTNLVDLAGSERVASTGAKGDRLKEGAAINQSLSALGNVISALADNSQGKKVKVPYRDSVLTKLLQNALGGNSKTVMIAAISPADINYDESMSTLRYADRAKQIKTKAVVNEDPTDKLIRELQEENKRLQEQVKGGGGLKGSKGDDGDYAALMRQNELEIEEMRKTYEEKLRQAEKNDVVAHTGKSSTEINKLKKKYPFLFNLNMDPQLNGTIVHILKSSKYKIGNQKGSKSDIVLMGPSIIEKHAVIKQSDDHLKVTIEKGSKAEQAKVTVNGQPLTTAMDLYNDDRIMFGTTQLYVFQNPVECHKNKVEMNPHSITWEQAQEEIANNSGFDMHRSSTTSADQLALQDELLQVMPAVEEANSISEALDKMVKFELVLVNREVLSREETGTAIFVRVRNFTTGVIYDWPQQKFMNRFYKMQELYEDVESGEVSLKKLPDDQDPFTEPPNEPTRVGACNVYLKTLAYNLEMKSQLEVTDFRGNELCLLNVELIPCDAKGREFDENYQMWVDNPKDLVNSDFHFKLVLSSAMGLPPRFTDVYCQYKFYHEKEWTKTIVVGDTSNPQFRHEKLCSFKPIKKDTLEYICDGYMIVELWAVQMPIKRDSRDRRNTAAMMQGDMLSKSMRSAANNNRKVVDMNSVRAGAEADVLKKRQGQIEGKVHYLRELIDYGESNKIEYVSLSVVKGILDAPNEQTLEKWKAMFAEQQGSRQAKGGSAGYERNSNRIESKSCVVM